MAGTTRMQIDKDLVAEARKPNQPATATSNDKAPRNDTMGQQLWDLYRSKKYSDLTIICGDSSWQVHKNILAAQSPVFAAMLDGRFKEANENVINLPDDDPAMIQCMIQFLYTKIYGFEPDDNPPAANSSGWGKCQWLANTPNNHAKVYATGDKYDIGRLMTEAKKRYTGSLAKFDFFESFFRSIDAVYNLTPTSNRALRIEACEYMSENYQKINTYATGRKGLHRLREDILTMYPDFAKDALLSIMSIPPPVYEGVCTVCAHDPDVRDDEDKILAEECKYCGETVHYTET